MRLERHSDAHNYYQQARDRLLPLERQGPLTPQLAMVLAQCHANLARLTVNEDREAAKQDLTARAIYQHLASEHESEAAYQIAWLETELALAMLASDTPGQQRLSRIAEIIAKLPSKLPSDANAVYRLASFLTQREPILSEADGEVRQPMGRTEATVAGRLTS